MPTRDEDRVIRMSSAEKPQGWKRWPKFLKFGLLATLAVGVAAIVSVVVLLSQLEPGPDGLVIENRTDEVVEVYGVTYFDERIVFLMTVGPRSIYPSGLDCPNELIARTSNGVEIERRPKPQGCDLDPWIINGASLES